MIHNWREFIIKHKGLMAYGFLVLVMAANFWIMDEDEKDDRAELCVRSHEAREDFRDAVEISIRGSSDALIKTVTATNPNPNLEGIAEYNRQVNLLVIEARAQIENPSCNLADARVRFPEN